MIDWSEVPSQYKFAAFDADGSLWFYTGKPVVDDKLWEPGNRVGTRADEVVDWRNSLRERPWFKPYPKDEGVTATLKLILEAVRDLKK